MPQDAAQSVERPQTAVEIHRGRPLTLLPIIFCKQVLAFQYFGQIRLYRPTRKPFKRKVLRKSIHFISDPDLVAAPHINEVLDLRTHQKRFSCLG
jgi:hypothetical protein